jgi:hypothetical protein
MRLEIDLSTPLSKLGRPIKITSPKPFYAEKRIRYSLIVWAIPFRLLGALETQDSLFMLVTLVDLTTLQSCPIVLQSTVDERNLLRLLLANLIEKILRLKAGGVQSGLRFFPRREVRIQTIIS